MALTDLMFAFFHRFTNPGRTIPVADNERIYQAVTVALPPFHRWTLYVKSDVGTTITVALSPNGGATWYAPEEAILQLETGEALAVEFGYDATHIQMLANNSSPVTAHIRGVF